MARHAVDGLVPFLDGAAAEDTALLVGELVTNCIRHAALPPEGSIEFTLRASPEMLLVEVADAGRGFATVPPARPLPALGPDALSGFGLVLVDRIATRWGAIRRGGETRVWFELPTGGTAEQPAAATSVLTA